MSEPERGGTRAGHEDRYRKIFEHACESIFLIDVDSGRVLEANTALQGMLGYTREELLGMTIFDLVAGDRESVDRNVRRVLEEGEYHVGEREYRHKDGSLVDVEVKVSVVPYEGARALCCVSHDITPRKTYERQLRRSIDSILAIYEASQLFSYTLESEEIGTRTLQIMQRASDLSTAVISVPGDDGELHVWRSIGLEKLWSRVRYTLEAQEALYEVLNSGEHRLLSLRHPLDGSEHLTTLYLPLRIHERTLGVLEVYGSNELAEGEMVEVLVSLSSKAASALENARLYGELAERERLLRETVGKLVSAREEERRRVAYEVHDELTQTAVAAYQQLQAFAHLHSSGSLEGREVLDRATELVRRTIDESRQIIADLRPAALDDFGLAAAVRMRVQDLSKGGWELTYEESLGDERLPAPLETALYRVAQESLNNVRKHAGPTRVRVELKHGGDHVKLLVRDWGGGFAEAELSASGPGERVGVSSMREQIQLLDGELEIQTQENVGTSVTARVPLRGFVEVDTGAEEARPEE